MKNLIIGIDPDLHKSGYALYDIEKKEFLIVASYSLWKLMFTLKVHRNSAVVYLEYPDNTNTWHKGGKGAALNVGKNQAIAIVLKEFLIEHEIEHKLFKPAGYSNFFKNRDFFKKQTGYTKMTNQDARASAAIVFINK